MLISESVPKGRRPLTIKRNGTRHRTETVGDFDGVVIKVVTLDVVDRQLYVVDVAGHTDGAEAVFVSTGQCSASS